MARKLSLQFEFSTVIYFLAPLYLVIISSIRRNHRMQVSNMNYYFKEEGSVRQREKNVPEGEKADSRLLVIESCFPEILNGR